MAATGAKRAFGTIIQRGDGGSPEVFTAIAEVTDVSGLNVQQLFEDATHMASDAGFAETIPTIREVGDLSLGLNLLPNDPTQKSMWDDLQAGVKHNWRVIHSDGTRRLSFAAYVANQDHAFPLRGKQTATLALKVTGPIIREAHS